jgi:hypothetical protein
VVGASCSNEYKHMNNIADQDRCITTDLVPDIVI